MFASPRENRIVVRLALKWWWVLVWGALCGFLTAADSAAWVPPQQSQSSPPSSASPAASPSAAEKQSTTGQATSAPQNPAPEQPAAVGQKPAQPKSRTAGPKSSPPPATKATSQKTGVSHTRAASAKRKKPISPRVRRMRQAFVASTTLRSMAQQLLQDRSPAAYAGVEAYARAHANEDAGALAWLVAGYAHVLDHDYAKAIDPLNRAKPLAGDLGDYVAYYLGTCYLQTGRQGETLAALADFATAYPDSLLVRDADVSYAGALLIDGRAAEAAELLEKDRLPARSEIELVLGKAYASLGQHAKAADALANVYYNMPAAPEADEAYGELRKLPQVPPPTATQRKTRGDLLMKAKRYNDAVEEYRELAIHADAADRPAAELELADALHHAGRNREAKAELTSLPGESSDQNAQRLYILGEVAWSMDENEAFYQTVDDLRKTAPASSWFEQALMSKANLHLVHHEYDQALDAFQELQQRFPNGSRASYAHWKAAWLTLRLGHNDDAKLQFDEQITEYPAGNETSAALYWRARLAEEDNQPAMARAYYLKLSERYRNYYYAELGRQRLKQLPATPGPPPHYAALDRVPPLVSEKIVLSDSPADDLHWQKAELLGNGGLVDFAVRELQSAASDGGGNWAVAATAQLCLDTGHYDRAIEVMKHSVPSYFAVDIPDLPQLYWEALFPRPYWTDLKKFSVANGLDPYLVASLIRQESEFNPAAVSRANAVGLMQLLPRTGKLVAHEIKLSHYNPTQLYTPTVNLQLGTR